MASAARESVAGCRRDPLRVPRPHGGARHLRPVSSTVFVRFNPDGYEPAEGGRKLTRSERRELLLRWMRWLTSGGASTSAGSGLDSDPNPASRGSFCEARYMCYDGCDGSLTPVRIGEGIAMEV